jgi:hypothetical protein
VDVDKAPVAVVPLAQRRLFRHADGFKHLERRVAVKGLAINEIEVMIKKAML